MMKLVHMSALRNKLNAAEAKAKIAEETVPRQTLSFYRYVNLEQPEMLRDELYKAWSALGVLGRIYLAYEGINAQISIPEPNLETFRSFLESRGEFSGIPFKLALEEPKMSFWKLAIKVRRQLVADNLPPDAYDITNVGTHLDAKTFNEELEKGAIVVDMRNKYESDIGKFENATDNLSYSSIMFPLFFFRTFTSTKVSVIPIECMDCFDKFTHIFR